MVQWDDKERGYPISEENGTRGMYLTCLDCKHSVMLTWAQILSAGRSGPTPATSRGLSNARAAAPARDT
jgi:hypothetical protein